MGTLALPSFLSFVDTSKYVLIFCGSILEGALVIITSGVLWHEGLVQFRYVYMALVLADLSTDIGWYLIGRYGLRSFLNRFGTKFHLTEEMLVRVESRFKKHETRVLIMSKLFFGFGVAFIILLAAGALRIRFKKFMIINFFGSFIWVFVLLVFGYFFGNAIDRVPASIKYGIAIAIILALVAGIRFLTRQTLQYEQ